MKSVGAKPVIKNHRKPSVSGFSVKKEEQRVFVARSVPVMTAAALIAFLMAAVEAFAVVMSAHMPLATVMTTIVTLAVMVAVMVASGIGIILKRPLGKGLCRRIGGTGNTAVEANPRLG